MQPGHKRSAKEKLTNIGCSSCFKLLGVQGILWHWKTSQYKFKRKKNSNQPRELLSGQVYWPLKHRDLSLAPQHPRTKPPVMMGVQTGGALGSLPASLSKKHQTQASVRGALSKEHSEGWWRGHLCPPLASTHGHRSMYRYVCMYFHITYSYTHIHN